MSGKGPGDPRHQAARGRPRRRAWPWDDRGRSAVTEADVRRSLDALRQWLPRHLAPVVRL